MDRSITSVGGVAPEQDGAAHKIISERVPPVLSIEQAAAMQDLKPFLKAVADMHRLAMLQELAREGGLSVLDLSERLALSQPLTSWHLHILKRARLVAPTHLGRQRIYRLDRERLQEYRELFDKVTDL
ncbi:MAG: ArsR/SmtB family transcription factor [Chloroflexia bacterium]